MANIELNVILNDANATAELKKMASEALKLESTIKQIGKNKIEIDANTVKARQEILNLKLAMDELVDSRRSMDKGSPEYKKATADLKAYSRELRDASRAKEQLSINKAAEGVDLSKAKSSLKELKGELKSATSDMNQFSAAGVSAAERVASAFSTIGSVLHTIGGGLQTASNFFGGRFVNTAKTVVSAYGTMGIFSAASGTVQRYDTMRMFPKMMEHLGYSATDATNAVTKLEEAVIGLPTGLDEIVASARQLIPLTGDLDKGVNLAIAANNAFLAGGSDSQSVNYGQRQIKDLLSKGKLRSQEWDSLFTALGSGLGVIAEEMGYSSKASKGASNVNDQLAYAETRLKSLRNTQKRLAMEGGTDKAIQKNADAIKVWEKEYDKLTKKQDKSLGTFRNALKTNQIDALDFLNALEKVGTGEGELAKRANDYKDTLSATARNIKNAVQKLGAAGLDSLDTILLQRTGKNLPQTIVEISDAIKQKAIPALEDWISNNGDKITGFLDRMKNYDWMGLVSKVGKGLGKYYDIMSKLFTKLSPNFLAFMSVWGGPLGRALGAFGSVADTIGRVISFFVSHKGGATAVKSISQATTAVTEIGNFGDALKGSMLKFANAAGFLGTAALLGGVIAEYAKVIELIGNIKIGSNFDRNMSAVRDFSAEMFGTSGVVVGIMAGLSRIGHGAGGGVIGLAELLTGGLFAVMGELGAVFAEYAHVLDFVAKMKTPDSSKWSAFGESVKAMIAAIKDIPKLPFRMTSKMDKLADATESMVGIAKGLKNIRAVGNIGNMSNRMSNIMKAIDAIMDSGIDKIDNKKTKVIAKNLEQFEGSTSSISNIAQSFMDFRKTTKGLNKSIIETYTTRAKIITKAVNGVVKGFEFKTKEREMQKTNLEAMSGSVSAIASIASSLVQAKKDLASITHKSGGGFDTTMGERVKAVVNSLYEPLGIFSSGLDDRYYDFTLADKNIQAFSKSITAIKNAFKTLNSIRGITRGLLPNIDQGNQKGGLSGLLTGGAGQLKSYASSPFGRLAERMKFILESLARAFNNINIDVDSGISEKITAIKDAITPLKETVDLLNQMKDPISKLGISKKGDWTLGDNIGTIVESLTGSFTGIANEDFVNLSDNATNLCSAVQNVSKMMTSLGKIRDALKGFSFADGSWTTGTKLALVIGSLTGIFHGASLTGGEDTGVQLASAAGALEQIATALGTLGDNASTASSNLKNAKSGVEKLGKAASEHKGAISNLATAVGNLKSNSGGIGGKATIAAAGISILGFAAKNQVGNLTAAASAAGALATAIERIPSNKTVNVSVTGNGATYQPGTTADFRKYASGGSVHGPSGIDNVKAWLTNGEFVMTRRAHNAFGTNFMNKVNSLDVDGALRALSIRAGSRVRSGYHVTNNYTRDNHASATFNISRASQSYSQKFASRWVRSLV